MMKKPVKISAVAGFALFILAALFSISLLTVLLDFGSGSPAHDSAFFRFGQMIAQVYGYTSVLIPLFLIFAGIESFTSNWTPRKGFVLLGSLIPFFTVYGCEKICRNFLENSNAQELPIRLFATLALGFLAVVFEYIFLSVIGRFFENEKTEEAVKNESAGENPLAPVGEESAVSEEEFVDEKTPDEEKITEEAEEKESVEEKSPQEIVFEETTGDFETEAIRLPKEASPFDHVFDDINESEIKEEAVQEEFQEPEVPHYYENAGSFEYNDEIATEVESFDEIAEDTSLQEDDIDFDPVKLEQEVLETESEPVTEPESNSEPAQEEETETETQTQDVAEQESAPESIEEDFEEPVQTFMDETNIDEFEEKEDYKFDDEFDNDFNLDDIDFTDEGELVDSSSQEEVSEPEVQVEPEEDVQNQEEEIQEPVEQELEVNVSDFEMPEEEKEEKSSDISATEQNFLENDSSDSDDEFDIISEFENNAALETEHLDDTIEVDPAFFGIDLNAEESEKEEEDVFAIMDQDAAEHPVLDNGSILGENLQENDDELEDGISQDLPEDIYDEELVEAESIEGEPELDDISEYEFDPTAKPVVDANGNLYEESVPIDVGEIHLEDIPVELQNAIKSGNDNTVHSSLEKTVFAAEEPVHEEKQDRKKPKFRMSNYKVPTDLLTSYENGEYWVIDDDTKQKAEDLRQTLSEFNIDVEVKGIRKGPVVTMFEVLPAPGVNVNKIRSLQDNIALRLAATSVRIVSPIPGKSAVGIEIPNKQRAVVSFKEIMEQKNPAFEKMAIPVILGKDISGEPQLIDLAKTPHLLIAGSTGAGKSVCVNSLILSILYKRSPQQVKMILIDPKVVELKLYNDIPHLLTPVITEPKKALQSLQYCLCEMERRYALLDGMGVRDIANYNKRIVERNIATEKLPYIVVIIDEFADLMATTGRELEQNVARLAAMSRAVGIHLVLATQRPSVNVITGLIKANIPSRIAFMVASRTDSNIIIDQIGAEKLLGKGDMLYASATDPFPVRIQGTLVVDDEVENVVEYVKQYGEPDYIDDEIFVDDEEDEGGANPGLFSDGDDPLYDQALQIVIQAGKASASYIQRRLKIGYNRAARLVEEMEERGIVGPQNGSTPREVIQVP